MWILHFIPDSFLFYAIFIILASGVVAIFAGFLFKYLPILKPYSTPVLILGILLTCASLYFTGGYGVEKEWREKVSKLEQQLKEAENKSNQANTAIQEKVVEKVKVIKGKTEYITRYLDREVIKNQEIIKYIENCPVPKELIDIHNKAANMDKVEVPEQKVNK